MQLMYVPILKIVEHLKKISISNFDLIYGTAAVELSRPTGVVVKLIKFEFSIYTGNLVRAGNRCFGLLLERGLHCTFNLNRIRF